MHFLSCWPAAVQSPKRFSLVNAPHSLNKHNYIWVNLREIVNTHLRLELVSPVAQADRKFFMSTQMT